MTNGDYEIQGIYPEFIGYHPRLILQFVLLYGRSVPKRAMAIAFNKDGSQIITADKFGDVYR